MTEEQIQWFNDNFRPLHITVNSDQQEFVAAGGVHHRYNGDASTVTVKFTKHTFEQLVHNAQVGSEETARREEMALLPNVQAAYNEYLTLLSLSRRYDR